LSGIGTVELVGPAAAAPPRVDLVDEVVRDVSREVVSLGDVEGVRSGEGLLVLVVPGELDVVVRGEGRVERVVRGGEVVRVCSGVVAVVLLPGLN
jgi:hypothetical protein